MPWRPGPAWPSGVSDATMVRAFRHECGILCAALTGLMESAQHTRLILDPSPLFQPALSSLGLSSRKKCSNGMLDKIKAILRDT